MRVWEMKTLIDHRFGWGTSVEYTLMAIVVLVVASFASGLGEKVFTTLAQTGMLSGVGQLLRLI
jgi:hypothetical protein